MTTPVDQESFAALTARFQSLIDQWSLVVKRVLVMEIVGAGPITLSDATHGGKSLLISNGSSTTAIQLTLPADAAVGTLFLVDQVGTSQAKLVPASGATLRHRLLHNGTAGQWASLSVKCIRNTNGASAEWLVVGDTAIIA